ncbi:hypothetical protein P7C73_g6596, partial [Tremellales sp. Uapishka_1]
MNSSRNLLPLASIFLAWYYLTSRSSSVKLIWLGLNVLDTLRALRTVRVNGRRIGIATRRKVMKESLICWVVYVAGHFCGPVIESVFGWLPFYSQMEFLLAVCFLACRVAVSLSIFQSFIRPFLRRYETPIDLTILLLHSLGVLILHYVLHRPTDLAYRLLRIPGLFIGEAEIEVLQDESGQAGMDEDSLIPFDSPVAIAAPVVQQEPKPKTPLGPPPVKASLQLPLPDRQALRRSPRRPSHSSAKMVFPSTAHLPDLPDSPLGPSSSHKFKDPPAPKPPGPSIKSVNIPARRPVPVLRGKEIPEMNTVASRTVNRVALQSTISKTRIARSSSSTSTFVYPALQPEPLDPARKRSLASTTTTSRFPSARAPRPAATTATGVRVGAGGAAGRSRTIRTDNRDAETKSQVGEKRKGHEDASATGKEALRKRRKM